LKERNQKSRKPLPPRIAPPRVNVQSINQPKTPKPIMPETFGVAQAREL
tara:strand:+ start:1168 stop:1314 length:147 start_codon:yes stop_codon:yes gene_type:complete